MLVDAESLGVPALSEPQMQLHVRGVWGEATPLGKPTTNDKRQTTPTPVEKRARNPPSLALNGGGVAVFRDSRAQLASSQFPDRCKTVSNRAEMGGIDIRVLRSNQFTLFFFFFF